MTPHRTDATQQAIVACLRDVGACVIDMTGDPRIGYDLTVIWRGRVFLAELKDGNAVPSARALTKREAQRKWDVERAGGTYHVWESVEAALAALEVEG
jgi:hypothetical protein